MPRDHIPSSGGSGQGQDEKPQGEGFHGGHREPPVRAEEAALLASLRPRPSPTRGCWNDGETFASLSVVAVAESPKDREEFRKGGIRDATLVPERCRCPNVVRSPSCRDLACQRNRLVHKGLYAVPEWLDQKNGSDGADRMRNIDRSGYYNNLVRMTRRDVVLVSPVQVKKRPVRSKPAFRMELFDTGGSGPCRGRQGRRLYLNAGKELCRICGKRKGLTPASGSVLFRCDRAWTPI